MNISNVAPCANVPITLTCTSNGGNPSGNPIEYEWKIITGTTANNPSSGVVNAINTTHTFTATGTYQVRLRVKVSCCGWSAPIYTTINVVGAPAAPTVPSGLATLCELTTGVAYTTNNVVGNTYNWSVVGGTIATGAGTNAPTVDWGAYTGTANIRVSATNSCGTSGFSPTLTVNLRRKPTAVAVPSTIPPNFCGNTGNLVISGSATQNSPGGNNTFTYLWSPGGQVTQNINVTNSTLTQSYTVVATEGVSGCQSLPATVNVVVNPSPVAPTFTDGATTLCANAVDTFAATTTQGTITYSIVGGTGASINATTGILSSAGTTNFSVRATSTAAPCGTAVTDRAVTVIPTTAAPTFTSGPISICPNATPTYVATTTGGTITYSIIGGNGAAINATTGALTSTGTANFTVRATATGTCSGPFFTDRAVTVQPGTVPATYTSGPTSICANSTATYVFSTTLGTITYSIVGGSGAAINPTTGVLTSSGTADFAVRATTTGTCGGPYISDFAVTVIPSAAAPVFTSGPTSICANNDGNYNATSISGVISYSVVGGTGAAIDPTSGYLSSAGTTNFIVRATATTPSCGSTSTDRAVTVLTTPDLVIVDPPTVCTPATVNITAPGVVTDANGTVGTLAYFANSTDANNNVNPLPNPTAISVPGFYYVTKTTTVGGCVDIDAIYADISLLPNLVVTNPPSVCSPGTVNLTAPSVVNDINGTVGTYSYFPTMADAVANTNPLANPISIASPGTYYIKKTTDAGGCTDIEPVVVTIVSCGPITWVGGTPGFQTNWDKPTNWTPNGPPTAVDVIIIPNVTYDPIISVDNGEAKDVTIAAGATIGINSGFILDIKGNWNGTTTTIVSGPGKTIFSGNAPQTITGGGTFSTLQINNASGVTIAAGANVVRATTALELKAGNLTTNGNLLTASTALHTTYIDDFSAGYTGTVTGNVRVERYITSGPNGFRYIGAPVATTAGGSTLNLGALSGFVISGTPGQLLPVPTCNPNSSAMNSPYGTFMRWEEAGPFTYNCRQAGWWFQTTGTMTIGRGYGAKLSGGNKITYTGAANTGAKSYGPLANSGPIGNGWHLVSNPYPSSMAISNVDANPNNNMPAGFDGQIQLYLTSGPYTGSYLAYNTGIAAAPFSLGQGFWVRTPSSGTFSLTNSYRVTNQVTYYDVNSDIQHHLKVDVAGNGYMDKTDIYFLPTAQTGLDFYDAEKWAGRSEQPTLYTSVGTQMTAINSLPSLQETVVVPMGVKPGTNGDFTFTFDDIATFPQTSMIYLEDLQLGTMNDLRANNTYNFTANVNDNADRFMLHFQPGLQAEVADQDCDNAGSIELTQPAPTVWSTYEVRGNDNNVYAQGTNFTGSVSVTNLPPQEYVVSVTHASGYTAQEFITVNGNSQVDATINASATNIMVDEMVSLTGVAADANEYVWNFGDGNTQSGSSSVVHAYDAEGIYTVSMTASNSTCNDVATKVINVSKSTTGIDGIDANNIKIYGQCEHVIIEFNNWGGNKADIFMYNALGQRMESLTGVSTLKGRQELYIADIVPGTYFIQVVSDGKIQGKKVFLGKQ
ncbi:MAG: PKD domain-containing protein [Sphingobacteriales bacterium JAD_PAG50586_3]|nr:MAG: PKD domain-containing protein [Sphingobacteriales bacterium JAD_PAG50586_3]